MKKFYITTAIPYVNAKPHLGHALEFVQADAIRRFQDMQGVETLLLSGADENALKNVQAAESAGKVTQEFVDEYAGYFKQLLEKLNVRCDRFVKGSDQEHHFPASQKLWRRCEEAGDIYKKTYEGLYCVGCEAFYTPDELSETGECFEHPGKKLEVVAEENYFFRLSKYQQELIRLLEMDELRIIPAHRKNEVLGFLRESLQDISISRSNKRAKNWGVPVPGDSSQRMYVWFDALNIYQSGVGFGWDEDQYQKWWPADMHVIGKGIIRFHAVYWPAFLLSAKLLLPRALFVHGYITVEGQKMSKTLGNVLDPFLLIEQYGSDPLRYYLLREIPSGEDGDFSHVKFIERYNGELANGLGNLVARVTTLGEKLGIVADWARYLAKEVQEKVNEIDKKYTHYFEEIRIHEAIGAASELITFADKYINEHKPWSIENEEERKRVLVNAAHCAERVAVFLQPALPETAEKVHEQIMFREGNLEMKKRGSLFPRAE
ncbi:MAG: methionine--tRNA ligase [Candidatus Sungbacteria bacterium]|nr:methionine--tRNA ligase [Candidatus Sungbacteria bacterium]